MNRMRSNKPSYRVMQPFYLCTSPQCIPRSRLMALVSAQRGTPYSLGSIDAVSEVGFSAGCLSRSNSSSLISV